MAKKLKNLMLTEILTRSLHNPVYWISISKYGLGSEEELSKIIVLSPEKMTDMLEDKRKWRIKAWEWEYGITR